MNKIATFYVDDDSDDIGMFIEASKGLDAEVVVFTGGAAMLQAMENPPPVPSVVFVDINMPQMDGYEVTEHIRNSKGFHNLPIIILSTSAHRQNVSRCLALGANYYIVKPTSLKQLSQAIQHVLEIDWNTFKPGIEGFVHQYK